MAQWSQCVPQTDLEKLMLPSKKGKVELEGDERWREEPEDGREGK